MAGENRSVIESDFTQLEAKIASDVLKPLDEQELLRIIEITDWEKMMEEEEKLRKEVRKQLGGYRPRCPCGHRYK